MFVSENAYELGYSNFTKSILWKTPIFDNHFFLVKFLLNELVINKKH